MNLPSCPHHGTPNPAQRCLAPVRRGPRVSGPLGAAALARRALLAVLLCTLGVPPAMADDDHERARAAVQAGEVMPLATLLQRLQRSHPGRVLEVDLEREDGRWVYELKLLQADGQLMKLEVDARSGEVLKQRRKGDRGDRSERGDRARGEDDRRSR